MAEQLKPCPAGHKAAEPHQRGWPEQGWTILCMGEHCGWETSGDSREDVICRWNDRTLPAPPPATRALLATWQAQRAEHKRVGIPDEIIRVTPEVVDTVLAEWPDPATPPAPEQSAPEQSPWHCAICGKPVRIGDDLRPWHLNGPENHEAELSDEDRKTLADGLRLTD